MITAKQVKELREKTGAGMMDCKKVLVETDGDVEKAAELLRERGITKAAKKSSRIAAEGLVDTYISEDGKVGVAIEVNAETDFVAKNDQFKAFVTKIAEIVAKENPADVEALEELKYDDKITVKEKLIELIATIGENMNIRRFERIETSGKVYGYVHGMGKIAVLLELNEANDEVGKNVCLQIAAMRPEYLFREEVPQERVEKEREILLEQVKNEGMKEAIQERVVEGRLSKFFEGICLVDQVFVKDNSKKIGDYVKENKAEIKSYVRLEKGEGLEKREENFAEEVAKQMNA